MTMLVDNANCAAEGRLVKGWVKPPPSPWGFLYSLWAAQMCASIRTTCQRCHPTGLHLAFKPPLTTNIHHTASICQPEDVTVITPGNNFIQSYTMSVYRPTKKRKQWSVIQEFDNMLSFVVGSEKVSLTSTRCCLFTRKWMICDSSWSRVNLRNLQDRRVGWMVLKAIEKSANSSLFLRIWYLQVFIRI